MFAKNVELKIHYEQIINFTYRHVNSFLDDFESDISEKNCLLT